MYALHLQPAATTSFKCMGTGRGQLLKISGPHRDACAGAAGSGFVTSVALCAAVSVQQGSKRVPFHHSRRWRRRQHSSRQIAAAVLQRLPALSAWHGRRSSSPIRRPALEPFQQKDLMFEHLECSDPGRSALRVEWGGQGEIVFEEASSASGVVRVYEAQAAEGGSWRRLRFNDRTEQSVVLLSADKLPVTAALPFGYLKTLAAVGTCTARALGRPEPPRALCIGVGGGALPRWLAGSLGATVDAVELDSAVLRAATMSMGLPADIVSSESGATACAADAATGDRHADKLRVYCCDGIDFVRAVAARKVAGAAPTYDMAIIDVFDGSGDTPAAFISEEFAVALGSITACAVVNLTCPVPMWEDAHEFNSPQAGELAGAWKSGFGPSAGVWSVRVPEGQNIVMAATSMGTAPEEFLEKEARRAAEEGCFAFDPVRRVAFRRKDWK